MHLNVNIDIKDIAALASFRALNSVHLEDFGEQVPFHDSSLEEMANVFSDKFSKKFEKELLSALKDEAAKSAALQSLQDLTQQK